MKSVARDQGPAFTISLRAETATSTFCQGKQWTIQYYPGRVRQEIRLLVSSFPNYHIAPNNKTIE